jgi:hypothetical protein
MDVSDVALSLLSGILGSVVGVAATVKLHQDKERESFRAAARVTHFEIAENTSYLTLAISQGITMPVRTTTWPETRGRLAGHLSPGDFVTVATAYAKLAANETAWSLAPLKSPLSASGMQATKEVLQRLAAAATVLERVGWPNKADQDELLEQLKEHIS